MSADIISCLQLDKELSSRIFVVREINGCDSSFILIHEMSYCIKNKQSLLIISTHNSMNHFQNIGLKMNINLERHIHSGLIEFYNLGEDILSNIFNNEEYSLQEIFIRVKNRIKALQEKHEKVNVVVDGISHLFDVQYNLKDINEFTKKLIEIVTCHNNSFIVYHCFDLIEDVTHSLSNLLSHKAHTILEVQSLPSGWSTDISGHLTVKYPGQTFDNDHLFSLDCKSSRYLFKLFDRGVKLFAPGTV